MHAASSPLQAGAGPIRSISLMAATQPHLLGLINHQTGSSWSSHWEPAKGVTLHPGRSVAYVGDTQPGRLTHWLSSSEAPVTYPEGRDKFTQGDYES